MALVERARAGGMAVTIDLTRVHQLLFHAALPGTAIDNDHWIRRKNAAVYRFGRSSFYMGVSCRVRGLSLRRALPGRSATSSRRMAGRSRSACAASAWSARSTVSGLPQEEDHRLVVTVSSSSWPRA